MKLVIIVRLQTAKGAAESALHYELLLWADIELGIALFAAACAALRPLLKSVPSAWDSYFSTRTKVTKYFSKPSTRSTRHTSSTASHPLGDGPYVEVGTGGLSNEDFRMNHLNLTGRRGSALEGSILKTTTVAVKTENRGHQRASSAPIDIGEIV